MKIAVIGAGSAGSHIARALVRAGHQVTVTAVDADSARAVAEEIGATVGASNAKAARDAEMVVLAVPYRAMDAVAQDIRDEVSGKIVIDVTNPIKPDYSGLAVSEGSGAQQIARKLPGARVVKAFNTVFAGNQDQPVVDGVPLDGYLAGDDEEAKRTVSDLLAAIGYRPVDVGGLERARALEEMALLNITFNARNDLPYRSGWKLVGPTA